VGANCSRTGLEPKKLLNHFWVSWSACTSLHPLKRTPATLALPLLISMNSRFEWYLQKALRHSSQTSALNTQYLVLDDCVPNPLEFVLFISVNSGLGWYLQKELRRSRQTSALDTQFLVLDDCVSNPLESVLLVSINFGLG